MTAEKIRGSGDTKIKKLDNYFMRSSLTTNIPIVIRTLLIFSTILSSKNIF